MNIIINLPLAKEVVYVFCTKIQHRKWAVYAVCTVNCGPEMNNIDSAHEILYSWTPQ
jgi:hypothetical protein